MKRSREFSPKYKLQTQSLALKIFFKVIPNLENDWHSFDIRIKDS